MVFQAHDIATRVQALALYEEGITIKRIMEITGLSRSTIYDLRKKARKRGYDPTVSRIILLKYVEDAPRSGRPTKATEEQKAELLDHVRKDRTGREKSTAELGELIGVSPRTAHRILRNAGLVKRKPTWKPGLTPAMREARLQFALRHRDWTLKDWKNVIWTDETSVVLGHRRGGVRVWRRPGERYDKTCVRTRWKKASEFMFWGTFSYEHKGPMHIWKTETAAEKKVAQIEIDRLNAALEPHARAEWELATAMRRMDLNRAGKPSGRPPRWKFTSATGMLTRTGGHGIDWFRYQKVILRDKLIPFALECLQDRPKTIVQEDKAPSHAHANQDIIFSAAGVKRLIWPGNSPDLNMIEPAWGWMKRRTTSVRALGGAPQTRMLMEYVWKRTWRDMEQKRIQAWIERIPRHIKKVIKLNGGNEYREGRKRPKTRNKQARKNY
jgi:transposase